MPALDIFSSSAFTMVALTDAINKMPYVPGRIGQLGLFREFIGSPPRPCGRGELLPACALAMVGLTDHQVHRRHGRSA
jgi:Phage major capsid protein E